MYAEEWAVRIHHEASMHDSNEFATFTYSDEELPTDGGLDPSHFTNMCKRVRAAGHRFRYFQCGEYGDATQRPHHHACIFGLTFPDREPHGRNKYGDQTFRSPAWEEFWTHGNVIVGELTWQSAAYVARYCLKKANGNHARERFRRETFDMKTGEVFEHYVKPEYVTMSRGNRTDDPVWGRGIGSGWFDSYGLDIFPSDQTMINGRRFKTPRYYSDKLDQLVEHYRLDPAEVEAIKEARREYGERHLEDNSYKRRKVREQAAKLRARRATRYDN